MRRKIFRGAWIYISYIYGFYKRWLIQLVQSSRERITSPGENWFNSSLAHLKCTSLIRPPPSFSFQLPLFPNLPLPPPPVPFFVSTSPPSFPTSSLSLVFIPPFTAFERRWECLRRSQMSLPALTHRRFSDPRRGKEERNIGPPRDRKTLEESRRDDDDIAENETEADVVRLRRGEIVERRRGWMVAFVKWLLLFPPFPPINYGARGVDHFHGFMLRFESWRIIVERIEEFYI